jgi:hypothetical protein
LYSHLRVWIALGLLITGILLLVNLMDPAAHILPLLGRWWPVVLIALGLAGAIRVSLNRVVLLGPALLMALGGLILLITADPLPPSFNRFLVPLLLVAAGALWLTRLATAGRSKQIPANSRLISVAESRQLQWPNHRNALGVLVAVVSGCAIAMRRPESIEDKVRLEINAIGSGIDVIIPDGWRVTLEARPVLGRCDDTVGNGEPDISGPELQIYALAVLSRIKVHRLDTSQLGEKF